MGEAATAARQVAGGADAEEYDFLPFVVIPRRDIANHRTPFLPRTIESGIDATKASFDKTVKTVRWLTTSAPRWFLPFWYAREPMFWLPHGLFPYYAEWLISFPRAPLGSVSVASWQLACTGVIALAKDAVEALVSLFLETRKGYAARQKQQPVKVAAQTTEGKENKKDS